MKKKTKQNILKKIFFFFFGGGDKTMNTNCAIEIHTSTPPRKG
jgi:hypothetical protein